MSALLQPQTTDYRPKLVLEKRKRDSLARSIANRLTLFLGAMVVAFTISSLAGQTLMEASRRESLQMSGRAREARVHLGQLRTQVEGLRSDRALESWATVRGFSIPAIDALKAKTKESRLVARR